MLAAQIGIFIDQFFDFIFGFNLCVFLAIGSQARSHGKPNTRYQSDQKPEKVIWSHLFFQNQSAAVTMLPTKRCMRPSERARPRRARGTSDRRSAAALSAAWDPHRSERQQLC